MKRMELLIELIYDDEMIHGNQEEAIEWFYNEILIGEKGLLLLHSNEIGDCVGKVKGIKVISDKSTT